MDALYCLKYNYFMIVGCTARSDDQDENPKCVIQPSNVNTLICESAANIAVVYLLAAGTAPREGQAGSWPHRKNLASPLGPPFWG